MIQRFSAVYLALFLPMVLISLWLPAPASYREWHDLVAHPAVNIAIGLFFLALLLHAWVGLRDVILDYVKPFSVRLLLLVVIGFTWMAMGLWLLRSLMTVTL